MDKLSKCCNHVSLLQAAEDPANMFDAAPETKEVAQHRLNFAEQAFPEYLRAQLPNQSLIRANAITDNHFEMSGKVRRGGWRKERNDESLRILLPSLLVASLVA